MTRTSRAAAVLAAGATAATLAMGAAPAQADVTVHADARKDAVGVVENHDDRLLREGASAAAPLPYDVVPAPTNKSADITQVLVRHTKKRMAVRTSFRDLDATAFMALHYLKTDKGTFQVQQSLGRGPLVARSLGMRPQDPDLYITDVKGEEIECEGARATAKPRKDVTRFSLPRRCLGKPAWVRAGTVVVAGAPDSGLEAFHFDSGFKKGIDAEDLFTFDGPGSESEWPFGLSRRVKRA